MTPDPTERWWRCLILGHSWRHVGTYSAVAHYACRNCPAKKMVPLTGWKKLAG